MLNEPLARQGSAIWRRDAADQQEASDRPQVAAHDGREAARSREASELDHRPAPSGTQPVDQRHAIAAADLRARRRRRWHRQTARGTHWTTDLRNPPLGPAVQPGILPSRSTRLPW